MINKWESFFESYKQGLDTQRLIVENQSDGGSMTSWWRVSNSPLNNQDIITKEQIDGSANKSEERDILTEIQDYMRFYASITEYTDSAFGVWGPPTSEGIVNFKKNFKKYDWECGSGGDKISKSFYKALVYSSGKRIGLFDRMIQDISQRPPILQKAWESAPSSLQPLNEWANSFSKSMIGDMGMFSKICVIDWDRVDTFEGIDPGIINKVFTKGLKKVYSILPTLSEERRKSIKDKSSLHESFQMCLEVFNYIRKKDREMLNKLM
ncbi:hypothetical protein EBU71_08780 [bacterium]|nr:hypothetical protein [Candidatus Elulimicrobium humile]